MPEYQAPGTAGKPPSVPMPEIGPVGSRPSVPMPSYGRAPAVPPAARAAAPGVRAAAPPVAAAPAAPQLPPPAAARTAAPVSASAAPATPAAAATPQPRTQSLTTEELDTLQRDVFMNSPDTATGARDLRRLLHDQAKALGYQLDENPNAYSISGLRKKLQEPLPDAGKTDAEALDAYLQSKSRPGDTQVASGETPRASLFAPEMSERIQAIAGQATGNLTVMNGDGGVDPNMLSAYASSGVTRRGTPDERWAFAHNLLNNMSAGPRGMVNLGFVPESQLPPMGTSPTRQIGALLPR